MTFVNIRIVRGVSVGSETTTRTAVRVFKRTAGSFKLHRFIILYMNPPHRLRTNPNTCWTNCGGSCSCFGT